VLARRELVERQQLLAGTVHKLRNLVAKANIIERMQQEFRRRIKTQAALPNESAVLRVFFGLWVSGQMKLHRIRGARAIQLGLKLIF
jgi:transposase-like protein